jgi:hypothetical protein
MSLSDHKAFEEAVAALEAEVAGHEAIFAIFMGASAEIQAAIRVPEGVIVTIIVRPHAGPVQLMTDHAL